MDEKKHPSHGPSGSLTDGKVTLLDYLSLDESNKDFLHRPDIHPGTKLFYQEAFFQFPLWIGDSSTHHGNLFDDLTALKEGRATLAELDFDSQLDGLKVCKLSYT